jgi:hypothetical protein
MNPERVTSSDTGLLEATAASGAIACVVTAAAAATVGAFASGSAVAPINATSHVIHGEGAANVTTIDGRHTALGLAINYGASAFWAGLYEAGFGRAAERGEVAKASAGAVAVAALAYVTDYHLVPKRLTPGWEERMPRRSLALIYTALALCLPVRGLLVASSLRRAKAAREVEVQPNDERSAT